MPDPVFVPAHVGGDDGIARQNLTHLGQNPLGHHRKSVALLHFRVALLKGFLVFGDLLLERVALDAFRNDFSGHPHQHLQILRSGILEEDLTGGAPPQFDRPQIQRLGPDLERLGPGRGAREKPEEEQDESGEPTDENIHK